MWKRIAIGALLLVAGLGTAIWLVGMGTFGEPETAGQPVAQERPAAIREAARAAQERAISSLGAEPGKQILFGDFHVHTTFSFDGFLMNLPAAGGPGSLPPADACDFARFCSNLDFWSINDHAENLHERLWAETVDAVRQCNAVSGDAANPDLVTYLGWEWSHIGNRPENHYGHKNVVLLHTDDERIPARPIGAISPATQGIQFPGPVQRAGLAMSLGERGHDTARFFTEFAAAERCPEDVPVRDLPSDCLESAPDPETLFAKLDDWGLPSIVIPHGTAWGMYTPAGSDWRKQLPGHDPKRQTLLELYSGHGNSEQLPAWREVDVAADGSQSCPEPAHGYTPSCWRAGELIEETCRAEGIAADECATRAADARQMFVDHFQAGWKTLPGQPITDWLDAGQAPDMFQPAFNFRPRSSGQYMLAIRDFDDPENPKRFEFGFIGSSDIHSARPGTGYKELRRGEMSDGRGRVDGGEAPPGLFGQHEDGEPVSAAVPFDASGMSPLQLFETDRSSAYLATGGLVAAHSTGRDRESIWEALRRKEVYATSGRRMLLWFDLIDGEERAPMGSTVRRTGIPRFRVRAAGSFEQKPGCPDAAVAALGEERIQRICLGECDHPSDVRRPITRIEVVRIRPQDRADEPVDGLVEDPWRVLPCPADGNGCVVEFADPEFASAARDAVYYVRAIEAEDQLIHGSNPLRCEYDESGRCVSVEPCGATAPYEDDCLSPAEPRAWSSPIFVDYGG
ncbi:MAG: DUF3604 domain-containing protein [Myxococcota bacterium]|nr:DUF3604 domain-containing protein [Myxococcota bacterium]